MELSALYKEAHWLKDELRDTRLKLKRARSYINVEHGKSSSLPLKELLSIPKETRKRRVLAIIATATAASLAGFAGGVVVSAVLARKYK